jgi:hypothetical protein
VVAVVSRSLGYVLRDFHPQRQCAIVPGFARHKQALDRRLCRASRLLLALQASAVFGITAWPLYPQERKVGVLRLGATFDRAPLTACCIAQASVIPTPDISWLGGGQSALSTQHVRYTGHYERIPCAGTAEHIMAMPPIGDETGSSQWQIGEKGATHAVTQLCHVG